MKKSEEEKREKYRKAGEKVVDLKQIESSLADIEQQLTQIGWRNKEHPDFGRLTNEYDQLLIKREDHIALKAEEMQKLMTAKKTKNETHNRHLDCHVFEIPPPSEGPTLESFLESQINKPQPLRFQIVSLDHGAAPSHWTATDVLIKDNKIHILHSDSLYTAKDLPNKKVTDLESYHSCAVSTALKKINTTMKVETMIAYTPELPVEPGKKSPNSKMIIQAAVFLQQAQPLLCLNEITLILSSYLKKRCSPMPIKTALNIFPLWTCPLIF